MCAGEEPPRKDEHGSAIDSNRFDADDRRGEPLLETDIIRAVTACVLLRRRLRGESAFERVDGFVIEKPLRLARSRSVTREVRRITVCCADGERHEREPRRVERSAGPAAQNRSYECLCQRTGPSRGNERDMGARVGVSSAPQ